MQKKPLILALLAGLCLSGAAQAALIDRGGGLIYDDVLNITWLQDANYAQTSVYDTDGRMNWANANAWAAGLSYGGFDDWRLPTVGPVNGTSFNYGYSNDGSTDVGWNITSPQSEMAYMYYVNLGLKGYSNPDGTVRSDWGIFGNGTAGGQNNVDLIYNLQSFLYWSGTEYATNPGLAWNNAWYFDTLSGTQGGDGDFYEYYAWAVRAGDVGAAVTPPPPVNGVPEPQTLALVGLGLLGLAMARRRG